jgi:voltage-gated potassium channel
VLRALIRPTLSAAALFFVYFAAPLDRTFSPLTVATLIACLALFAGLIVFQTRVIVRSPYPGITAITALAFSIPLFVLLFATVYYLMERSVTTAFTAPMSRIDALYFTVTVLSTVGFGDIAAHSEVARAIVTFQMVADLLLIGLVVRVMLNAVQTGKGRALDASAASAEEPDAGDP